MIENERLVPFIKKSSSMHEKQSLVWKEIIPTKVFLQGDERVNAESKNNLVNNK